MDFNIDLRTGMPDFVAAPRLIWRNCVEMWNITWTGRSVDDHVTHWRASISCDHHASEDDAIVRINDEIVDTETGIIIPFSVWTAAFGAVVDGHAAGVRLYCAIYGDDDRGKNFEYIEFPVIGFPAVDPPADNGNPTKPRPLANYYTKEEIDQIMSDFEPSSPGSTIDRNPVVEFTVADSDWGRCVWLSEATPLLTFADRVYGARRVRMLIVSGDTTLPGNAVLIPVVAGVEQSPVTVSAGVEPAWVEISLGDSGISGSLAFRRDYESADDTLSGEGAVVALVVLALEVHYA